MHVKAWKNHNEFREPDMRDDRLDEKLYRIGKWIWIPVLIVGIIYSFWGYDRYIHPSSLFMCRFKRMTGIPCPGCGMSRAVAALFKGNIIGSFMLNPAALYMVLAYLHFMILCFVRKNITKTNNEKRIRIEIYCYILIGILLLQWIVKIIGLFLL